MNELGHYPKMLLGNQQSNRLDIDVKDSLPKNTLEISFSENRAQFETDHLLMS